MSRDQETSTPPVEWAVGALGGAVLAAMVYYLVRDGLAMPDGPPQIALSVEAVSPVPGGHLVTLLARNLGPATAEAVRIEGVLTEGGAPVETSLVEIDILPQGGKRRAGLYFVRDPAAHGLALRRQGYLEP